VPVVGERLPAIRNPVDAAGVAETEVGAGHKIRRTQNVQEAPGQVVRNDRAGSAGHSLRAIPVHDRFQTIGDFIHRLIPRDAGPLALATLTDALQRVKEAILVIKLIPSRHALVAERLRRDGMIGIAANSQDLVVFDVSENAAFDVT